MHLLVEVVIAAIDKFCVHSVLDTGRLRRANARVYACYTKKDNVTNAMRIT